MYDIALSVNACVRSKTRAEIAWLVSPNHGVHALALTPGGGRIGKIFDGAFDGAMSDHSNRKLPTGRLLNIQVNEFDVFPHGRLKKHGLKLRANGKTANTGICDTYPQFSSPLIRTHP